MKTTTTAMIPSIRERNSQIKLINKLEEHNGESDPHQTPFEFDKVNVLRNRKVRDSTLESLAEAEDKYFNESYLVIEFDKEINKNTLHWIIDKIRGKKSNGGAELIIRKEPVLNETQGLILHLSASKIKFLELADEIGFQKKTKHGQIRNFNVACLDDFYYKENMTVDDILTPADRQVIIKYALDNIRANENEKHFRGKDDNISLYHGESIIQAAIEADLIVNLYSLHDKEKLKKLGASWYGSLRRQPLEPIREYFGESIGMYFAFVGFYTMALVVPTILGFCQYFFSYEMVPFFCAFYVIWMKIFLERWKRKSHEMAFRWGTISMTNLDSPRIGFYGKIGRDPVTGKLTPQYEKWKTLLQMYFISVPIMIFCIIILGTGAISQFWIDDYLKDIYSADSYILYLPSIIYAVLLAVVTVQYDKLATWLTDKENHRTQSQYERHRVNKLIVLEFVNNFLSLFYVAFWLQDLKLLRSQLMTQMIILQFIQNAQETLLPYLKKLYGRYSGKIFKKPLEYEKLKEANEYFKDLHISELDDDDIRIIRNQKEIILDEYNTYDDYLELYIQFGYVVLFSSVAPLASFWALLNNLLEIRLDSWKLCKFYRRPFARRTKNIGAWQLAFEVLAVMSIMTNCFILYLSPAIKELQGNMSSEMFMVVFVSIEHVLLGSTWFLHKAIPDCPLWVRIAMAKADYESAQALKRENTQRAKHILFRRFKSVLDNQHQSFDNL